MKKYLLPLLLTVFIDSLGFGLIYPLLTPLIMQSDGLMAATASLSLRGWVFGIIISTFCVGQFFGGPILGAISDRIGRKKVICGTLIIAMCSYLLSALAIALGSIWLFVLSRLFVGISSGNFAVAQSMVADLSTEEQKRNNFGFVGMAWGVGFILGPFLGGRLVNAGGITAPFLYASLFCLLNILLAWYLLEETMTQPRKTKWTLLGGVRDLKKAFTHPALRGIFIVTFLFSLGWGCFTEFSAIFLIDRFGFGPRDIGNFYAYAGIWVALCQGILIRPLIKRFTPEQLLRAALFFLAINLLIFLGSESSVIVFIALPFIALPESLIYPNSAAIVSNLSSKDEQGEMLGILNSVQWASMGFLPFFSGSLIANYPLMPILFASLLIFCSLGAFSYYFRKQKPATS